MSLDPRVTYLEKKLDRIKRVWAVVSGKGGVGKSTIASVISLLLKEKGFKTGLLDLDIYGPSTHIILGVKNFNLIEEKGVLPQNIDGLEYLSILSFTKNKPFSLRGDELTEIFLELFTITNWGDLDFLIIDMPPGLGDTTLDLMKFIKKSEYLLISNSSRVSMETVLKLFEILKYNNKKILGLIENMKFSDDEFVLKECEKRGINYLGSLNFYFDLDYLYGNVYGIINSDLSLFLYKILERILNQNF
ncbi:MAG: P-loop NTPase [Caldisericia bacterium]|jgi:ATP-binding protein involved in chromosome partitioning|nr:P-loop NTPase [Caldisericia bacterium]